MTTKHLNRSIRGYLEGYYGKLLSWEDRGELLKFLSSRNLNTYCYAPKEDPLHRLQWRKTYSPAWQEQFSHFCAKADQCDVSVVAGIAPGLDFNFQTDALGNDFEQLLNKAKNLQSNGAAHILILWDDIDDDGYIEHNGLSEGAAHAHTVNQLSEALGHPLWTVPRVYAADIDNKNRYLEDFFSTLNSEHTVLLCGNAIVTSHVQPDHLLQLSPSGAADKKETDALKHRTVVWDNFYANDYCPRKLFVGPWTGRDQIDHYLLNPTGLPFTDRLLLDVAASTHTSSEPHQQWKLALARHGVPDEFQAIAPYFSKPFFGDQVIQGDERDTACVWPNNAYNFEEIEQAIEHCLWKWKTPLAREWYPYIFGLKHDLAIEKNALPHDRILKTQTPLLASRLLS